MKVSIKGDNHNFSFRLPNRLLFSKGFWSVIKRLQVFGKKSRSDDFGQMMADINPDNAVKIRELLKLMRIKYPDVPMVHVQSSDGHEVVVMP